MSLMKSRFTGFLFFITLFIIPEIVIAEYTNPLIKVLLLKTSSGVIVENSNRLKIDDVDLFESERNSVIIRPSRNAKAVLNKRVITQDSFWISGEGTIKIQEIRALSSRNYRGLIEIKPYENGLYIINHIPLESYLHGVLNAEISTKWHVEVVKAQAVISRTFALYKRQNRLNDIWHISASQFDQIYKGANIEDEKGRKAIVATQGVVVSYQGKLAQTFYHSNCGGMTENPSDIWNSSFPYLNVKSVPYGSSDPRFHWKTNIADWEIKDILSQAGISLKQIRTISVSRYTSSGRAGTLTISGNEERSLKASDFRRLAGYQRIQSLFFEIIRIPGGFHFKGKGNGHGVGLSQWSAKEMAEAGYKYQQIIQFFYKNTQLGYYNG